jgi:hypothetical protein
MMTRETALYSFARTWSFHVSNSYLYICS